MILWGVQKKHLKKEKLFSVIENENKDIKQEVEKILDNKGKVLMRKKGGIIRGLFLFEAKDEKGKVLNHKKNYFIKEVDDNEKEKILKSVEESMSQLVSLAEYEEVIIDNKKIEQKKTTIGKTEVSVGLLIFLIGLVLFLFTDDILWCCLGFVFGFTYGFSAVEIKKQKRKKVNKNKKDQQNE